MSPVEIKEKMLEFTQLFSEEDNSFQRFVFVYQYIEFLNEHPHIKDILQKIFDETARLTGEVETSILEDDHIDLKGHALLVQDFWTNYTRLEVIHGKMKKIQTDEAKDEIELDKLHRFVSKPYSDHLLHVSFKVVNSEVFDRLDKLHFRDQAEVYPKTTWFDEAKSVLHIKGERVRINIQDTITNAHKMLRHFFIVNKNNRQDDFYYAEIAEQEFGELEYAKRERNWWRYRTACLEVNKKVEEQTKNHIKDFLIFNTDVKGRVKINPKYL